MDCTQPFSPCKGLSAVSFVNGCWLVNTVSLTTLTHLSFSVCMYNCCMACLLETHRRSKILFQYSKECVFLKMGKVMFRDGTKAGSLSSPLLHPASTVPTEAAILCLQFDSSSPRAFSNLIECFYLNAMFSSCNYYK